MSVIFLIENKGNLYEAIISENGSPSKLKTTNKEVDLSDLVIIENAVLSKSSYDSLLPDALEKAKLNNAEYIWPNFFNNAILYLKKKNTPPVENNSYSPTLDAWWPPKLPEN